MLNIAARAARQAGRIAVRSYERGADLRVNEKGRNDFVSEVDRACEAAIIEELRGKFPDHAILAEESGSSKGRNGSDEYQWIIDPLDGTTNYLHGFPQWSISIGLRYRGLMEQGVVYDPLREELFTASRGSGAMLNDRRIRVSDRRGLSGALIGTGIPFRDQSQLTSYLSMMAAMIRDTAGIRRPGSAALDFAYFTAGALLVAEAGGTVTDLAGGDRFFETCNLVAGGLKVHRAMIERLKPIRSADLPA